MRQHHFHDSQGEQSIGDNAIEEGEIDMSLNTYRDETGHFLEAIHASDEPVETKIRMLQQELDLLKNSAHDARVVTHQVYDLLFLLFEIASQCDIDLDSEWLAGQSRKVKKYL